MRFLLLLLMCCLVSCSDPLSENVKPHDLPTAVSGNNLLYNPEFKLAKNGMPMDWRFSQHSGARSYSLEKDSKQGVVVSRIGKEPWGKLFQTISLDGEAYLGQTLVFSAFLVTCLNSDYERFNEGSGIKIRLIGRPLDSGLLDDAVDIAIGERLLQKSNCEDYGYREVVIEVPKEKIATDLKLELSLVLAAGGHIKIAKPSVRIAVKNL